MHEYESMSDPERALERRAPRVAAITKRLRRTREGQLEQYAGGARVVGLDQLLGYLEKAEAVFAAGPPLLAQTELLVKRAHADFVIALDATLAGLLSVAADAMRDVLEIEMLLLDFALDPDRLDRWLSADDGSRRREFAPVRVRERLEAAGVGEVTSSVFGLDYAAHSAMLHVNPRPLPLGGKAPTEDGFELDAGFWEIFEHGRRLLLAVEAIRVRAHKGDPRLEPLGPLDAFRDAHDRVMEMQEMFLGFLEAPKLRAELGRDPTAAELLTHVRDRLAARDNDTRR